MSRSSPSSSTPRASPESRRTSLWYVGLPATIAGPNMRLTPSQKIPFLSKQYVKEVHPADNVSIPHPRATRRLLTMSAAVLNWLSLSRGGVVVALGVLGLGQRPLVHGPVQKTAFYRVQYKPIFSLLTHWPLDHRPLFLCCSVSRFRGRQSLPESILCGARAFVVLAPLWTPVSCSSNSNFTQTKHNAHVSGTQQQLVLLSVMIMA